jgi:cytochrome c-type biogenesis protein CcmE
VGIGFVVYQGLGNATLYFHNVDEALAQRDDLGTRSFRLQGLVRDDVREDGTTVRFTVTFNGSDIAVVHRGDPPDLFRPGLPVVLEGHFAEGSTTFESNRILVKHSEEYEAENTDRITDAEDGREDGDGG